jgi:hypothetical protein
MVNENIILQETACADDKHLRLETIRHKRKLVHKLRKEKNYYNADFQIYDAYTGRLVYEERDLK